MSINYIIQGRKLDKECRLEEAIACFKKAIEINPQFSWYYFYLGESLIKQKQNYEAIKAYSKAVKLNPNSTLFKKTLVNYKENEKVILCKSKVSKVLIVFFGGMSLLMGGILPFKFLRYLLSIYADKCDLRFYIDAKQCQYHKGIEGISNNIDETTEYLKDKINERDYKKIIFMGISSGGYAAILFVSLCHITNVISFIPRTNLKGIRGIVDNKYENLKNIINNDTDYLLYGDLSVKNKNSNHHISQCENLEGFSSIKIVKKISLDMKKLRDDGTIKNELDKIINQV